MICEYCSQEIGDRYVVTCYAAEVQYDDGTVLDTVPFEASPLPSFAPPADWATRRPPAEKTRCPGCGVAPGAWHHVGCPDIVCSRCGMTAECGCHPIYL